MRILYGVCGEGAGHAARSAVVAQHLLQQGHEVHMVASSRGAYRYLAARVGTEHVSETVGFTTAYRKNKLAITETVLENGARLPLAALAALAPLARVVAQPPDAVISDFDPWSAWVSHRLHVPLVALDNIHFGNRCQHSPALRRGKSDDQAESFYKLVADRCVPGARRYMVTALGTPLATRPDTTLHLPIVRTEVQRARWAARQDGPPVAYFNSMADHATLRALLHMSGLGFRMYGAAVDTEQKSGDVTLVPFSDERFVRDLAAAPFVIGGAGFTLASECAYLKKPLLCVPFGNQYEQILNASYHEALGYGRRCDVLTPLEIRAFAEDAPAMGRTLAMYRHDQNRELLSALDGELEALTGS